MLEGLSEIKAQVRSPLVKPPGEPPLFLKRSVAGQRSQSSSCYGSEVTLHEKLKAVFYCVNSRTSLPASSLTNNFMKG